MRRLGPAFLGLAFVPALAGATTLDQMLRGFPTCEFDKVYVDYETRMPLHPYFAERGLKPYKIENSLPYIRVNDSYRGLPVVEIVIPAASWALHAITIDLPLVKAQQELARRFGSSFPVSQESEDGRVPELIEYRLNRAQSVLLCKDPEAE